MSILNNKNSQVHNFDLLSGLTLVWLNQSPDFQKIYDINTDEGLRKFKLWWKHDGIFLYPAMEDLIEPDLEKNELFIQELGIYISSHLNNEFIKSFNNKLSISSKATFILKILSQEVGTLQINDYVNLLSQIVYPVPKFTTDDNQLIGTNLCNLVWLSRSDLREAFNFNSIEGKSNFLQWWNKYGILEFSILLNNIEKIFGYEILFDKTSFLSNLHITVKTLISTKLLLNNNLNPFSSTNTELAHRLLELYTKSCFDNSKFYNSNDLFKNIEGIENKIELLQILIFYARPDLIELYQSYNSEDYKNWWIDYGIKLHNLIINCLQIGECDFYKRDQFLFTYQNRFLKLPSSFKYPTITTLSKNKVNLIGIPHSSKGVSEDFRFLSKGIKKLDLDVNEIPFPERFAAINHMDEYEYLPHFSGAVNIFVQSPFFTVEFFVKNGYAPFLGHKNFAFWQWEFDSITPQIKLLPPVLSEIWTISKFIADGIKPNFDIPVLVAPQTVSIDDSLNINIDKFIKPSEKFYFMFAFDGESYFERKNPLAVIKAFKIAFPLGLNENVGLIIKFHSLSLLSVKALIDQIDSDSRISLIDEDLDRPTFISIMKRINCFVSLHRAEGFGRLLAEAMLLNKPVIASNYSGNLDYMDHNNSYLVKGEIIPVKSGEYHAIDVNSNANWFQPDIQDAAECMRQCFNDVEGREKKSSAGFETINQKYNSSKIEEFLYTKLIK